MSNFSGASIRADARRPPRIVVLQPGAFADTWPLKPLTEVAVGLRLIASSDVQAARGVATEQARKWFANREGATPLDHESFLDAYNDGVMRHCVARACTDPNDVSEPYFPAAEDTVRDALTEEGVRRLWDELIILHASTSINIPRADDTDVERLVRVLLDGGAMAALGGDEQIEMRTILGYALTRLVGTGKASEAEIDTSAGGYVVRSAQ